MAKFQVTVRVRGDGGSYKYLSVDEGTTVNAAIGQAQSAGLTVPASYTIEAGPDALKAVRSDGTEQIRSNFSIYLNP